MLHVGQLAARGHHAVPVFLRELQGAVHEVAVDGHEFGVVALLEIAPHEVVVFRFRGIGGQYIAQNVLFSGEIHEILVQPDGPVARGRDFIVFEVQKLVGRHVVGHNVTAVGLHHHGEDDAVEHDVVLADEMYQSRLLVLPPALPRTPALGVALAEFLRVRDVADGRIEPHVEHFSVGSLHGHGDSPVQIARHCPRLQVHVEPRTALSIDVRAPFLVPFENPLLQPLLIFVERQIPVFRLFQHGRGAADGRFRVDELCGREVATAFLALVAVSTLAMTVRTFAHDVAVGQKLLRLFVVELRGGFLGELALVVELAEEVGGKLVVRFARGARIHVERDAEVLETLLDERVVAVHHVLRRDALLPGANRDGHAVFVGAADVHHVLFLQTEVAHVDVGRHIHACQMADVDTAVGIGQRRRDGGPLIVFVFHNSLNVLNEGAKLRKN